MRYLIVLLFAIVGVYALLSHSQAPDPEASAGTDWYEWVKTLQEIGFLRTDRAPKDAVINPEILALNFEKVAFGFETDFLDNDNPKTQKHADIIKKWMAPINVVWVAPENYQPRIKDRLEEYAGRLSSITKQRFIAYDGKGDAQLLIFYGPDKLFKALQNPDKNLDLFQKNRAAAEWLAGFIKVWRVSPSPCAGKIAFGDGSEGQPLGVLSNAVILIRSEIPDLLLNNCVEEELAQVMGLPNDDHSVRPSLFNDVNEFALLTDHDAELLRVLYDPRIEPGMSPAEAMPIVREILGITTGN